MATVVMCSFTVDTNPVLVLEQNIFDLYNCTDAEYQSDGVTSNWKLKLLAGTIARIGRMIVYYNLSLHGVKFLSL